MTAKAKFKSDAFEAIHSAAAGMYSVGSIDKGRCAISMKAAW